MNTNTQDEQQGGTPVGYGFFFDSSRCTGCRTCMMACMDYHDLPAGRKYRRVIDFEGGQTTLNADGTVSTSAFCYHVSLACNHCNSPACIHVCPTGAMHKDENALVWVDTHRCIGCGYCTIACPYHAPSIDPNLNQSSKCDGCTTRVSQGLAPICVEACPLRALDFGETAELHARHPGSVSSVVPLPPGDYTNPNLTIKPCRASDYAEACGGFISDQQAIENNFS